MTILRSVGYGQRVTKEIETYYDVINIISNTINSRYINDIRDVHRKMATLQKAEHVFVYLDESREARSAAFEARKKAEASRVLDLDATGFVKDYEDMTIKAAEDLEMAINLAVDYGLAERVEN